MIAQKIEKLVHRTPMVQWYRRMAGRAFSFGGSDLEYAVHRRNYTWTNERCVELPIVLQAINELRSAEPNARVLEVGNVLSHYVEVDHTVVDKYEEGAGVINKDIVGYQGEHRFDLIVSISTIEHIGWDCGEKQANKIPQAIDSLMANLAAGGRFLVTMPLGFNTFLDDLLDKNAVPFTRRRFLKRVSSDNQWVEADWSEVRGAKYGSPYICANAIVVGEYVG